MDELKPCPFCGAPATLEKYFDGSPVSWIRCDNHKRGKCFGGMAAKINQAELIAFWNTRPSEDALQETIGAYSEAVGRMIRANDDRLSFYDFGSLLDEVRKERAAPRRADDCTLPTSTRDA